MKFILASFLTILFAFFCASNSFSQEGVRDSDQLRGSLKDDLVFRSAATEREFEYELYLPPAASESNVDASVLYVADAQWGFKHYAESVDRRGLNLVLVGLHSGDDRLTDFAGEGKGEYLRFFKEEFVPFIEAEYQLSGTRGYMGVSLSALLGAGLLMEEPVGDAYFSYYLLFDGPFQFLMEGDIEQEALRLEKSPVLDTTVFLTSASPGNREHVVRFQERYDARPYKELDLTHKAFNVKHTDIASPSYEYFLNDLFEGEL